MGRNASRIPLSSSPSTRPRAVKRRRRCDGLASMATTHCPICTGLWSVGAQLNVLQFTSPPITNMYEALATAGRPVMMGKVV